MEVSGNLRKMVTELSSDVQYHLPIGNESSPEPLDDRHWLFFTGVINCIECDRKSNKSFSQGYCFPCFRRLAACDSCIVSYKRCHYDAGTCREPDWAQTHCFVDHIVYLANTSGVKVGITSLSGSDALDGRVQHKHNLARSASSAVRLNGNRTRKACEG